MHVCLCVCDFVYSLNRLFVSRLALVDWFIESANLSMNWILCTSKKLSKTKMDPEKMLLREIKHLMNQSLEVPCQFASSVSRGHESLKLRPSETQGPWRFNGKRDQLKHVLRPWHWPKLPWMAFMVKPEVSRIVPKIKILEASSPWIATETSPGITGRCPSNGVNPKPEWKKFWGCLLLACTKWCNHSDVRWFVHPAIYRYSSCKP